MKLGHVLQSSIAVHVELDHFRSDELKRAARFWLGKEAGSYNKDKCIAALNSTLNSDQDAGRVLAALSEKQREILAIFSRYGPTVPGGLLTAEIYGRGLVWMLPENKASEQYYHAYREWRRDDPIQSLCEKLVLIGNSQDSYHYFSSSYNRSFPQLTLHPALLKAVAPAAPLSWSASRVCGEAIGTGRRSSAEVALDLWRVAGVLRSMGTWPTVKGDAPAGATRARMQKEVGLRHAEKDPLSPPDAESLFYQLLHGMGLMNFGGQAWIREEALERHMKRSPAAQGWYWVRAWLHMPLWQDGIGTVPERDNDYAPARIQPLKLRNARQLLAWALCGVAHAPHCWLDLETFLRDLWRKTQEASFDLYWGRSFAWNPEFEMAKKREQYSAREDRMLAFWLNCEGGWAANAIMVTLVALGLVERGQTTGKEIQPCFRLTEMGRMVFGAPEVESAKKREGARFLTMQPNLEVVAYLELADAAQICTLSRFADCAPRASGPVQTFALRRESLYRALESGMTLEEVRAFLAENGKTELPANVDRMLSDWAGRRESLVLRTKVVLALGPAETRTAGRTLNRDAFLLPAGAVKTPAQQFAGWKILNHEDNPERTWTTDELGNLTAGCGDSISRLRLARIADHTPTGWQITQQSVERACRSGMTADQILGWLGEYLTAEAPALLEVAVRNWTRRQGIRLTQVQLLRIMQPQTKEALLHSETFQPFLAGHIPPQWFLIRDEHVSQVRGLLERLGFTIGDSLDLPPLGETQKPAKDPPAAIVRMISIPKRRRRV